MTTHQFQKIIWRHYRKNKRKYDFPWRQTRDPYKILVSEIMLQQTQIPRVIPKYKEWMRAFPTIHALAKTPFPEVVAIWKGLGYNRRTRYLKTAAEKIVKEYNGKIPEDLKLLQALPGIGHYTARAITCFSHGACEPFLDTNIRRVFIEFFAKNKKRVSDDFLLQHLKRVEPKTKKREWYLALMDYGREALGKTRDNPNKKSVSYAKQSPFKGSRRYVRAKIISLLVSNPKGLSFKKIKKAIAKDPQNAPHKKEMSAILNSLVKEKLIEKRGGLFSISAA